MGRNSARDALLDDLLQHAGSLEREIGTLPETPAARLLRAELEDVRRLLGLLRKAGAEAATASTRRKA